MRFSTLVFALVLLVSGAASGQGDSGIVNESSPAEGVVFGGQPTEEQLRKLAAAGYETIIDLRGEEEDRGYDEAAVTKALGLDYRTIPMTRETMGQAETWDAFVELFSEVDRPVLVHCASGNRVGAAYYAYLVDREGLDREAALEKAKTYGLRSESLVGPVDSYLDGKGK
ncbi:MAG: protein tyrosine phosphatase family protein [Thermoanaerobaculia bacterium]|nr:protein tyrosine phosphatase family protein [Thermoanaerobaculia bacterium]